MGLKTFHINTAEHADLGSPDRPLDAYEQKVLQNAIDSYYGKFLHLVAKNRELDSLYVDSIGQGRVWSGSRALELGLVDAIGGMYEARNAAEEMADLEDNEYRIVTYPKFKDPIQAILKNMGSAEINIGDVLPEGQAKDAFEFMKSWENLHGKAMMKMEMEIVVE
jgi:protease-4